GHTVPAGVKLPSTGSGINVGLRPEHIEIDPEGDTHAVELTEALGGVSYAYLTAPTGEKLIVEERGDDRSKTGARVGLKFDPGRAYFFDANTEARLR
ncbi:MAG: TOBE domain-containing protein, partial [Pseudomonadota bacterium]